MSKRIIDLPDEVVKAIQNGEDYRYDIHTAIAQSKPYDDSVDLISRSALKETLKSYPQTDDLGTTMLIGFFETLIDNAPTVQPRDNFDLGYVQGVEDSKRPQGEWKNYSADFYKCPECGYLLNKLCPQCHNKVILPKGGAE